MFNRDARHQYILDLLHEHGPLYGSDMVRISQIERKTKGKPRLGRVHVYIDLDELQEAGFVRHKEVPQANGLPRALWELTRHGHRKRIETPDRELAHDFRSFLGGILTS